MRFTLDELRSRVEAALVAAGAAPAMAASTARALVLAEAQGQGGHGLSRVVQYATHLRNGRVNGYAQPVVLRRRGGALLIDSLIFTGLPYSANSFLALGRSNLG